MRTQSERQAYVREFAERVPCSEEERAWLWGLVRDVKPEHKSRAMVFRGVKDGASQLPEPGRSILQDFYSRIDIPDSHFGWVPYDETFLLVACIAAVNPTYTGSFKSRIMQSIRSWFVDFKDAPLISIIKRAVDDDFVSFLRMQAESNSQWQNFGEVYFEEVGPKHARNYCTGVYPEILEMLSVPMIEGFYEMFEMDGEVRFVVEDEDSCTIDYVWR